MKLIKIIYTLMILSVLFSCRNADDQVISSGVFEATELIVSSQSTGEILSFIPSEGDLVEKGQVLGRIDSVQLELQREQLQSAIELAESSRPDIDVQLAPLVQQINTAEKEKGRAENLVKAGATNEKQLDDVDAQVLVLRKQLIARRSELEKGHSRIDREIASLEIQIEQVSDKIKRCSIISPISGTVLLKYAENGELAVPGKALVKIADMNLMFLRAYISSSQLTVMKLGQEVQVVTDLGDNENRLYRGIVKWISSEAEFTPKTIQTRDERSNLVYAVKVAVPNDGFLKIGMYGGIQTEYE